MDSADGADLVARRGHSPTAPYSIAAEASAASPTVPVGGLTVIRFPNNHLAYAITWFILAVMAVAGFLSWNRASPGSAESEAGAGR